MNINQVTEFKTVIENATYMGTLPRTGAGLGEGRRAASDSKYRVPYVLCGTEFVEDIKNSTELQSLIDPVARHSLLDAGMVADCFGMRIWTDAYEEADARFVPADAIYFIREHAGELKAFGYTLE